MKRVILSILAVMAFVGMQAQSYDYLTFVSNGGEKSMKITGTVISFSNGNMVVKNAAEEYTVALSDLKKFYFSDEASAIEAVADDSNEPVVVYSVSGQLIGNFDNAASAKNQLSKGIYVVKGKNESKKMMVE